MAFAFIVIVSAVIGLLGAVAMEIGGEYVVLKNSTKGYRGIGLVLIIVACAGFYTAGGMP